MYTSLPVNEAIFDFEYEGDTTGYKYEGTFKIKCVLNIADRHRLELETNQMSADLQNPSTTLTMISRVLAALRVHILDAPTWWKESGYGANIIDDDCLYKLFDEVLKQERLWKEKVKPKPQPKEEKPEEKPEGN